MFSTAYASPLGRLTLASDGKNLTGLWIEGQKYFGAGLKLSPDSSLPIFRQTGAWLDRYFAGEQPSPALLPLAPAGSGFRQAVWKLLAEIPYGETVTYGRLAKQMAALLGRASMSAQAVGGAVGHNPISIIIPCHRVIGSQGSLTGYAGGIDKKIYLLQLEGVPTSNLSSPPPKKLTAPPRKLTVRNQENPA